MKYVTATLPRELEYIDIYSVSDVHRGNRLHDRKAWQGLLSKLQTDEHAFAVLNGDLTEMVLRHSKYGDIYRTMTPKQEREVLQKELEPVKDKILLLTDGNHDLRMAKETDESPVALIAEHLGLGDKYEPLSAVLKVEFGNYRDDPERQTTFQFYVTHGRGQGRRPGGALNRMQELAWVMESVDGYLMGHVHSMTSHIEYRHFADPRNEQIGIRPVAFVIGGSFVNYGDYVEENMLTPNAVSMPILRLYQREKRDASKHMEVIMPTKLYRE
jgi:hypothetical protein